MSVVVIDLMGEDVLDNSAKGDKDSCEGCTNCTCGKKAPAGYDTGLQLRSEDDSVMLLTAAYKVLWERWPGK